MIVLSIPDWGCTRFAKEKGCDIIKIAKELDEYNIHALNISFRYINANGLK